MATWFITGASRGFGREVAPERVIADYNATAGAQRRTFREGTGKEPGDPELAAIAIVDVAMEENSPHRLPLGNFAYDGILENLDAVRADIAARESISRGADRA